MPKQIITDPQSGEKICKCFKHCGGCQLQESYADQLARKQEKAERMLGKFAAVQPIISMAVPYAYRNKIQNIYGLDKNRKIISGIFQSTGKKLVAVDDCMLEDAHAAPIVQTLKKLMHDMKITPYDLRDGTGILRHTLIRVSSATGEIMLVLVTASAMLPSKNNLVKAIIKAHPEITTIVQNICPDGIPLTLGKRNVTLYGSGFIEDVLCGCRFRISPASFYQVNSRQTERLYGCAVKAAGITEGTTVIDAYCGTGTIGIIAAKHGAIVTGVEQNRAAVRDAVENARRNQLTTIRFYQDDAGAFMQKLAKNGEHCDVLIMDPPRAGASPEFLRSAAVLSPDRIVYVSCCIETLERDLLVLKKSGYCVSMIQPVDMFPHTTGIETVVCLNKQPHQGMPKEHRSVKKNSGEKPKTGKKR